MALSSGNALQQFAEASEAAEPKDAIDAVIQWALERSDDGGCAKIRCEARSEAGCQRSEACSEARSEAAEAQSAVEAAMQSENVGTVAESTFTECEAAVETGEVTCQNMHQLGCMQVDTGYECDARAADIVTNTLVGSVTQVVHQSRRAA